MAGKENAAPVGALGVAGPRLTRAAAKRAAAMAAEGPDDAKRRRVALGELPALANNALAPSRPVKPSKPASRPARPGASEACGPAAAAEAERCASFSPPRAADAESNSASYSPPRTTADTAFSAPPRAADAESNSASYSPQRATADTAFSAPPRAAAPADLQLSGSYASDIYTYLRSLEVLRSAPQSLAFPQIRCICVGSRLIRCLLACYGFGAAGAGGSAAAVQIRLHRGGAGGRHGPHAKHPRRLARRGRRGVQARRGHALPHHLLCRPLSLRQRAWP
jgi:cyclin-A